MGTGGREERVLESLEAIVACFYIPLRHINEASTNSPHAPHVHLFQCFNSISPCIKIYLRSANFVLHSLSFRPIFGSFRCLTDQNSIHIVVNAANRATALSGNSLTRPLESPGSGRLKESFSSILSNLGDLSFTVRHSPADGFNLLPDSSKKFVDCILNLSRISTNIRQ